MFTKMWNYTRHFYEVVLVKVPNRYQGFILFLMLLAIWYR